MNQYSATADSSASFYGQYAGFWRRSAAATIDTVLYLSLFSMLTARSYKNHPVASIVIFLCLAIASYAWFFASRYQMSPGMFVFNFHVTDTNGQRLDYKRALKWCIVVAVGMLFCLMPILYIDYRFDLRAVSQLMSSCKEQNIMMEDCFGEAENMLGVPYQTFSMMAGVSLLLTLFLQLIWSLSTALSKDKSGFHNLICDTRFTKGRV